MFHVFCMPSRCLRRWLDHLIIFDEEYELWSSSLCSFLHRPDDSCVLGWNILLIKYPQSVFISYGYRPSVTSIIFENDQLPQVWPLIIILRSVDCLNGLAWTVKKQRTAEFVAALITGRCGGRGHSHLLPSPDISIIHHLSRFIDFSRIPTLRSN
jgi:hypothetical protein